MIINRHFSSELFGHWVYNGVVPLFRLVRYERRLRSIVRHKCCRLSLANLKQIVRGGIDVLKAMADQTKPPLQAGVYDSLSLPVARELAKYKDPRAPKRVVFKSAVFALKRIGFSNGCLSKMLDILSEYTEFNLASFSLDHLFGNDVVQGTLQCLI